MLCPNCGKKNPDGRKYCANCKSLLNQPSDNSSVQLQNTTARKHLPNSHSSAKTHCNQKQTLAPAVEMTYASPSKSSSTGTSTSTQPSSKARKRKRSIFIGSIIAIVACALLVAVFIFDVFGINDVPIKSSVNDYSWEELSRISNDIAQSPDEKTAIEVAKRFNLVSSNGTLDGTQVKEFELTNGEKVSVQIAGFVHDSKVDGGKAGITFTFCNAVESRPFNSTNTNSGGWEKSQIRSWLNSDWLTLLPKDLQNSITIVAKKTNNSGGASGTTRTTFSSDKLWLFSYVELCGTAEWFDRSNESRILAFEGTQYKLFKDCDATTGAENAILVKLYNGSPCWWWERSADPLNSDRYFDVHKTGGVTSAMSSLASSPGGVVPGFCI